LALSRERGFEQIAALIGGTDDDIAFARDDLQRQRLIDLGTVTQGSHAHSADRQRAANCESEKLRKHRRCKSVAQCCLQQRAPTAPGVDFD
jgi:hypothetical protein